MEISADIYPTLSVVSLTDLFSADLVFFLGTICLLFNRYIPAQKRKVLLW